MPKRNFFSVVFEIKDPGVFKELSGDITDSLANETILKGAVVTACGLGDFATAHDAFEQELREKGIDPEGVIHAYVRDTEGLKGEKLRAAVKAIIG